MRILLVSDTHLSSRDTLLLDNWNAVERWIASQEAEFVIHLGDITANGADEGDELAYAHAVLVRDGVRMLFIPGNHDIGDHDAGPGHPTSDPLRVERLHQYREVFGSDRWSIEAAGWQLIGINAPLLATGLREEELQYEWLEAALAGSDAPLGLFLHKPMFRDDPLENIVHTRYVPAAARARLRALLAVRDLRFVASGHTHQVRQTNLAGVEYVWVPSTAFTVPDARQEHIGEKMIGTMLLEIEDDAHVFTHVIPAGMKPHDLMEFEHVYPALAAIQMKGSSH